MACSVALLANRGRLRPVPLPRYALKLGIEQRELVKGVRSIFGLRAVRRIVHYHDSPQWMGEEDIFFED